MKILLIIIFLPFIYINLYAQAKLIIENDSKRTMTVKIMRQDFPKGKLHEKVVIAPFGRATVYFSRTGYFFTKTKAVLPKRETIYQKGEAFEVINDDTGYSEITLTFTIEESSVPQILGGKRISQSEFEKD